MTLGGVKLLVLYDKTAAPLREEQKIGKYEDPKESFAFLRTYDAGRRRRQGLPSLSGIIGYIFAGKLYKAVSFDGC